MDNFRKCEKYIFLTSLFGNVSLKCNFYYVKQVEINIQPHTESSVIHGLECSVSGFVLI